MKTYIGYILVTFMAALQILVSSPNDPQRVNSATNFCPESGWINDPTELTFIGDKYIICYQYNSYSNQDGNISWGQATSQDLVNWTFTGVAIPNNPRTQEQRFTGTGVVDSKNTSGLGGKSPAIVVAFTNYYGQNTKLADGSTVAAGTQQQYLAYVEYPYLPPYRLYKSNPRIGYPPHPYENQTENFRDPYLMWYEQGQYWIMIVALSELRRVIIYRSYDLIHYTDLSFFGSPLTPKYQWECPGLFQARLLNSSKTKWVLLISTNPGAQVKGPGINPDRSATGSCMHYHVGHFDGSSFTEMQDYNLIKYLDYGSDFYAGNVFNNVGNRILLIGWVNNWEYATNRTEVYKGALSFVRELFLMLIKGVYRLIQKPISELQKYVTRMNGYTQSQMEAGVPIDIIGKQSHKFVITIKGTGNYTIVVAENGTDNEQASISNDYENQTICVQKMSVDPSKNGSLVNHCTEYMAGNPTIITLFLDIHSITVLCDLGWPVFTELVIPIFTTRIIRIKGFSVVISVEHYTLTIN